MDENKKKKLILGIVAAVAAVLLVVVIVRLIGCFGGGEPESQVNGDNTENTGGAAGTGSDKETQESGKESSDSASNGDSSSNGESVVNKLDVTYHVTNQWQNGPSYFKQYDFKVQNLTDATQENWWIAIKVENGVVISSSWNCECKVEGDTLYIRPGNSYGAAIQPNGTVEGIGMIIESPSDKPLIAMLDNNSQQVANNGDGNGTGGESGSSSGNSNQTSEESSETTAPKPTVTVPKETIAVSGSTPLARHGRLSVSGTGIVDQNGAPFRLCGVSTHGLQWFPQYVNKGAFQTLRDDWGANVIRLAMYVKEGGYTQGDKAKFKKLIDDGVTYATELGMYVIIDWHVLSYNPNETKSEAITFFTEMAQKYSAYNNIIYEICNEPTNSPWGSQIKPYATEVVSVIRKYDKDAIIIVGTNTWSQDVDEVIGNRLDDKNVMYAVHFYAATHKDWIRDKVTKAVNAGIPVFISECSICDASGSGGVDYNEADKWFNLLESKNISYVCWNLCNKNETSALLSPGCSKTAGFTDGDLSVTGKWFKKRISADAKGK